MLSFAQDEPVMWLHISPAGVLQNRNRLEHSRRIRDATNGFVVRNAQRAPRTHSDALLLCRWKLLKGRRYWLAARASSPKCLSLLTKARSFSYTEIQHVM